MPTPDEEALARLRALKKRLAEADGLYDRFGDERLGGASSELKAEIARTPAHVLKADAIETQLHGLTVAVEDYIVARAAQFLPDVADLWATVRALPERAGKPETPAETPVIRCLNELQALGASEDDIRAAVLRAASLDSYQDPSISAQPRRGETPSARRDYAETLRRHVRDFLKKNAGQTSSGFTFNAGSDLVALITRWQRDFAAQTEADQRPDSYWARYYRQAILSDIAALRKIGRSEPDIEAIIRDAYEGKRPDRRSPR